MLNKFINVFLKIVSLFVWDPLGEAQQFMLTFKRAEDNLNAQPDVSLKSVCEVMVDCGQI